MQAYPKWLFKNGESKLVANEAEADALGKGWSENPTGAEEAPGTGVDAPPPTAVAQAAYVPTAYPKWLYASGKRSQLVADAAGEQALGAGWSETPGEADAETDGAAEPARDEPDPADAAAAKAPKAPKAAKAPKAPKA